MNSKPFFFFNDKKSYFLDVFTGAAWLTALLMVLGAVIMIPA
jgi:hypothetical protein